MKFFTLNNFWLFRLNSKGGDKLCNKKEFPVNICNVYNIYAIPSKLIN